MVDEARLEPVDSGLTPVDAGWFVVNALHAAWVTNEAFGARCLFESDGPVIRHRSDLDPQRFPQLGCSLALIEPGQPSTLYHAESKQEDFLVLAGECVLIVEDEERPLRAWDFVHCPPGTAHVFVGAGRRPCLLLMVGARGQGKTIVYPESEVAARHGGAVETETSSPHEAYAPFGHWQPGRPEGLAELFQPR